VFPNFYFILIAASGQKKSTPISLTERLLRRVTPGGPNIIAQKISPEALINAIKSTEKTDSKNLLKEHTGGIVIADELATFLDRGALDRGLGPILTKLYDCSKFEYTTLARGVESVEDGYLSILGGTTVELLRNCLPRDAIGGGFTSRTIFIYEDKIAPPVPWVEYDEDLMNMEETLVQYLIKLTLLTGPVRLTKDARAFYDNDYNERYYNGSFRTHACLSSYENRRSMHLFKIAIAIMVSEEPQLELTMKHMMGAKILLEEAETYMPRVMDLIVASDTGAQTNVILAYIKGKGVVSRQELVKNFSHKMDSQEISKTIETLMVSNQVGMCTISGTGKLAYKYLKGD
jgi:antitoxin (DNA-binding transcriptional repressor) of toxin-antitoxin stability system